MGGYSVVGEVSQLAVGRWMYITASSSSFHSHHV